MAFKWGEFSDKQLDALDYSTARINIWHGSVRSGKTITSVIRWLEYIESGPEGELLMVGKTERTLKRNILDVIEEIVGSKNYHYNRGLGEVTICGRKIYVAGANDERSEGKIRGLTLAGAYGDEVTLWPESFFKMLLSRLSVPGAKFFGTTNPDGPYHWLKQEYIDRANELNLREFHFTLDDNINLDEDYKKSLKQEYTGLWYKRFIDGLWVLAEGVIYDMFNEEKHVVPTIDRPYTKYYVSIDYGTQNPTVFGLWGYFNDIWYKVKEYHYSGRDKLKQKTDTEYADDLDKFTKDIKDKLQGVIVDPSAASFIAELRKRKYTVLKAKNDVLDGIRKVATALNKGLIKYNDCCKETFREFSSYVWDEKASERGEDKPIKQNDHHMDSDRYFVNTVIFGIEKTLRKNYSGKGARRW